MAYRLKTKKQEGCLTDGGGLPVLPGMGGKNKKADRNILIMKYVNPVGCT